MPQSDTHSPVTILGAGIVGICTALSLLERGVPVRLIDRGAPGQATSSGNAGVVSPWSFIPQAMPGIWKNIPKLMFGHGRPLSIHPRSAVKMLPWGVRFLQESRRDRVQANANAMARLCTPSIELFEKHLSGTGHEGLLVDSIYLQAFRDSRKATLDGLDYQIRAQKGADMEVIGRDQLAVLEPALSPDFKAAVLIKGAGRVLSPGRVGAVLAEKVQRLGGEFVAANIRQVKRQETGWMIHCDDEDRMAQRIVICLGAWTADMLSGMPLNIPLMSERGYHAEFADPGIELNNSVMDVEAKFIASSMEGGVRVAGHAEFAPPDAPPSKRRQNTLVRMARAAFPDLNKDKPALWMGCRPSFPDSLPIIDAVDDLPGLFLNFGHSHFGLMMAPASGEVMAHMICGDRPNQDTAAFSAQRFNEAYA